MRGEIRESTLIVGCSQDCDTLCHHQCYDKGPVLTRTVSKVVAPARQKFLSTKKLGWRFTEEASGYAYHYYNIELMFCQDRFLVSGLTHMIIVANKLGRI